VLGLSDRSFFALAVLIYGLSTLYSVFLWRRGFRKDDRVTYLLLLAGVGFHTIAMAKRGFSMSRCPVTNLYEATIFIAWAIAAVYLAAGLLPRLRFLGAFASPVLFCVGVFALMPKLDRHGPDPALLHGLASVHAALTLLAYGAFGLGSVAGLMFLTQERDLKHHRLRAVFSRLPSIQRLEAVTEGLLFAGFLLLTVGLFLGSLWLHNQKGVYFKPDPKILWSWLVWLAYLSLLLMHWRSAQGGRRFAWGAVGGFGFVMLTFWGFSLLSEIHHQ
jgi:ABC-type transport system involved in cytochrome c biogenesis permease subunit